LLLSFNSTFTKLLGYNQHDLEKGLSPLDLAEDSEKRTVLKRMERRLAGREVTPESHTVDIRSKDGKTIPCEVKGTLIQSNGQPADLVIIRDIRERKQAEELIHNLSRQLLTAQESERQMIAYELHDSVAQDLSSSRIICEILLEDNSLKPTARKQISEISENLHTTLKSVRDLSYELRPPGLEDLGLAHTMYRFCEDFSEQTGISVDFQSAGMGNLNLNYNTKINLYRLLQEGLNNIKKHADAGDVKIRLISSFPNIILRIYDDGRGFDLKERVAKTSSEKRMGLSSMEQRVDLLLGIINIESSPGKGTKVVIKIPYKDVIEIKSEI
jgi:PAS domain S-box-containing protein